MKYIAQYHSTVQVSPDDWERISPALAVDDSTTIGEIREWVLKNEKLTGLRAEMFDLDVRITKLSKLTK